MAVELTEANKRIVFLEAENAELYADIKELRTSATSQRYDEMATCRNRMLSAEANVSQLEHDLGNYEQQLSARSADLEDARKEITRLHELNRHLQHELKRLQERSTHILFLVIVVI